MVFIPRWEKYKDKKPTGLVEVDYGHELSTGLVTAIFPQDYRLVDLTNDSELTGIGKSVDYLTRFSEASRTDASSSGYHSFPVKTESARSLTIAHAAKLYSGSSAEILLRDATVTGGYIFGWRNASKWDMRVGATDYTNNGTFNLDTEYLYVASCSSTFSRLYVDSKLVISGAAGGTQQPNTEWYIHRNGTNAQYANASTAFVLIWDVAKSQDEVVSFSEYPYQILKPRKTFFVLTQSSGVTVTGTIAANAASISATTTVTRKASGELGVVKAFIVDELGNALFDELGNAVTGYEYAQADIAAVVQLGDNIIANLSANDASIAATATVTRQASGSLTAQAADLATTTSITRKASGSLTANAADVNATATLGSNLSAALSANNSSVSATTTVTRHATGTFNASVAEFNSNIAITRKASGSLDASSATLTGSGAIEGAVAGSGALQATDSQIVGSVALIRTASGALVPVAADIAASVTVTGTQEITGSGALVAGNATMSNSVDRPLYLSDIPAIVEAVWADKRALTLAKYLGLK